MSVEQWGILAFVILVPLMQAVAWLRRAHVNHGQPGGGVGQPAPTPRRGPALATRAANDSGAGAVLPALLRPPSEHAVNLGAVRASRTPTSKGSASLEAHTGGQRPLSGDAVVQWLRPTRNLRRAIVVAAILGPPKQ